MAKQVQSEADRAAAEELEKNPIAPKGHATPTRKEREAQRKRPLVGANTPEAKAMTKEQQRAQRERARIGLANGEEKYLAVRDRGPQKRFIRDYLDARWGFAELFIPVVALVFIAQLLGLSTEIQQILEYAMYAFLALIVIDLIILYARLRRALAAKFGDGKVDRIGMYPILRAIYLRPMRTPRPQVKRGEFPS